MYLLGSAGVQKLNGLPQLGATDDGVVDQQDVIIAELGPVGVQFTAHGLTTQLQTRHDERTAYIADLNEALTEPFAQNTRDFQRDITRGFRDRDHHVDIQIFPFAGNFLAQFRAHIHAGAVN